MNSDILREQLEHNFPFLEKELREKIIEIGVAKQLKQGDSMIQEGEYIRSFPLVLEGCLRICRLEPNGNELLIYYLNQGSVCTMSLTCCMGRQKSNILAIAEEETTLISLPVELLDEWMSDYKTWKTFVMYSFQARFEELLQALDAVAFLKMDQRLEKFFKDWYNRSGSTEYKGSHQAIAQQLNSSREVISRLLKQMENSGIITLSRNLINFTALIKKGV